MAYKDFDAARRAYGDDNIPPVTFALAGEVFELLPDPTLGDTFDIADTPDLRPEHFDSANSAHIEIIRSLCQFVKRMLPVQDRPRWDAALYRVPVSHMPVIIEITDYIAQEVIDRPTVPPSSSSTGRLITGPTSNSGPVGVSDSS